MKKVFEFEINASQAEKAGEELYKQLEKLRAENKLLIKSSKESTEAFNRNAGAIVQNKAKIKDLSAEYRNAEKEIIRLNRENIKTTEYTKAVNKEMAKEVNTLNQASQQVTRLNKIKKTLNVNNKEEKKLLDQINKRLDTNNQFIKENNDQTTQQKINIGNYQSALSGISPQLAGYMNNLKMMQSAYKANTVALKGTNKGLKAFKFALIATGIGAIVVIIGLLVGAFLKTQRGVDALTRQLVPLKVVFESMWGVVEDLGTALVDAFKNPKEAVSDLWETIKLQFINRLEGMGGLLKNVSELIQSVFDPDIKTSDVWDDMQNNLGKMVVGVDDIKGKWKATSDAMGEAYDRGKLIAEASIEISKKESEIALKRQQNLNIIKQQELISKDKSKTQREINEALKIAEEKTKENLNNENELIGLKIKKLKLEQESNDTSREELQELNELEAEIESNKIKAQGIELRFLGVKNRMQKENATAYSQAEKKKEVELHKQQAQIIKNFGDELALWNEKNRSKIEADKKLSEDLVNVELARLWMLSKKKKEIADTEFQYKITSETEHDTALLEIENEYQDAKANLVKQFRDQEAEDKKAERQEARTQRQLDFEIELETISLENDTKAEQEALRYENSKALLLESLEDEKLTKEQYNVKLENLEEQHNAKLQAIAKQTEIAKINSAQQTVGQVGNILKQAGMKSKSVSIALALVDTYLSAQKAYASQLIPGDPTSMIRAVLAGASATATGLSRVGQIRKQKFAKGGGLSQLEGKSHAQGGEDIYIGGNYVGEMEGDEILGIMSKQASQHFLAFNDMFTNGNSSNGIFASGGGLSAPTESAIDNTIDITSQLSSIKVINVASETEEVINDTNQTIRLANV